MPVLTLNRYYLGNYQEQKAEVTKKPLLPLQKYCLQLFTLFWKRKSLQSRTLRSLIRHSAGTSSCFHGGSRYHYSVTTRLYRTASRQLNYITTLALSYTFMALFHMPCLFASFYILSFWFYFSAFSPDNFLVQIQLQIFCINVFV